MKKELFLRQATIDDCLVILSFIQKLADYEKMSDDVFTTVQDLEQAVFINKYAEVVIAECDDHPIGIALYFYNFSTFLGKPGLYLEDLFLDIDYRGYGFGKQIMQYLAKRAIEKGCGRFEWTCLDWNEPSLAFYRKIGAVAMDEWTVQRVEGKALITLANE